MLNGFTVGLGPQASGILAGGKREGPAGRVAGVAHGALLRQVDPRASQRGRIRVAQRGSALPRVNDEKRC